MKLYLAMLAAGMAAAAAGGEIGGVKTVYVLPMSNALDQFLAIRLTTGNVLQVVTDPQKADAILTDHIGAGLDKQLDDLYGSKTPAPPPPPDDSKDKDSMHDSARPVIQPISRARGTIFLIDRKSRNVAWSLYERPKNTSPDEINHVAEKIASKLSKDLKGK
jgi:hypothetical protein